MQFHAIGQPYLDIIFAARRVVASTLCDARTHLSIVCRATNCATKLPVQETECVIKRNTAWQVCELSRLRKISNVGTTKQANDDVTTGK